MIPDVTIKQINDNLTLQTKILESLLKQNGGALEKHDAVATTQTANPLHGFNGLFSTPGLNREVITAYVRPSSFAASLPLLPSVDQNPIFPSITGFTAAVGNQPADACLAAPHAYMKGCNLTARFGRIRFDTNTIEIDKVMQRTNRGEMTDLVLRGQVLGLTDLPPTGLNQNQILNILTASEMVTVGVLFERELTRQLWQGVVTVANEFPGLAVQIATGQKDSETGVLCPALDSDVKSYGYHPLSANIVNYLSAMEFYLFHNATRMGLTPVNWKLVMRPELWLELSAVWPCAYYTNRCGTGNVEAGTSATVDGREMTAIRDSMRAGMYIEINGRRYEVATDDGIFEHNNANNANVPAGSFASTIYFVPLTIVGGMPVCYREYVDFRQAAADVSLLQGKETFWWTDSGVYSWALNQTRWCYDLSAKTEQRVVLRTPQLAGRLDAVLYTPMQHLRDAFPSSPYHADGGVSLRATGVTPYAAWSGR